MWDAIASAVISRFPVLSPSLDLGSGNGIFSFITAGGVFTIEYDWYRNVDPRGFWQNRDIYDCYQAAPRGAWIARQPSYRIDCALDAKPSLLHQAGGLDFYRMTVAANANHRLPFKDESFQTVFSNMLYWLESPEVAFREVRRVLRSGGKAILCLQDPKFREYCISYQWRDRGSRLLQLLNRGRDECNKWTISYSELLTLARSLDFKVVLHSCYLSPLTLRIWDIGLRPLSPVLIRLIQTLSESDRQSIKSEWIDTVRPFLIELYQLDMKGQEQGGFHFVCIEKT